MTTCRRSNPQQPAGGARADRLHACHPDHRRRPPSGDLRPGRHGAGWHACPASGEGQIAQAFANLARRADGEWHDSGEYRQDHRVPDRSRPAGTLTARRAGRCSATMRRPPRCCSLPDWRTRAWWSRSKPKRWPDMDLVVATRSAMRSAGLPGYFEIGQHWCSANGTGLSTLLTAPRSTSLGILPTSV